MEIVKKATKPRTTLEEREAMRQQIEIEAERRRQKRECRLQGLETVREVARAFAVPAITTLMPPIECLDAATAALKNIRTFLEEDDVVRADFNVQTEDEFCAKAPKDFPKRMYETLLARPDLNDAIEYNAGQLLQHLERIQEWPEARSCDCRWFTDDYPTLRILRNHIEHGNPIIDTPVYQPGHPPESVSTLKRSLTPIMIRLYFSLLPHLQKMRADLQERFGLGMSSLGPAIGQ